MALTVVRSTKLKAVDPKTAEPSKPKILIFGKPGVGKTWASLDFPEVYYMDSEGGANLSHYTDKLKKSGGVYFGPEEGAQSFEEVIGQLQALASEPHPYKTVVIDSISKVYNTDIAREMERLGDKDQYGASKKLAVTNTRRLINWIGRIDMNVILIAHEKPAWANGEQKGSTYDAWEKLEYELDLSMQIVKQGASRKAYVRKSRLASFPDESSFDWSYEKFAELYGKDVIEKEVKQLVLATPEQIKEVNEILEYTKLPEGQLEKWFTAAKVTNFEEMDSDKLSKLIQHLKERKK